MFAAVAGGFAACTIQIPDLVSGAADGAPDVRDAVSSDVSSDMRGDAPGDGDAGNDACVVPTIGYFADDFSNLYSFVPGVLPVSVTPLGKINCEANAYPYSIAASRDGKLWWLSSSGLLFTIDPARLADGCTRLPLTPYSSTEKGFVLFGMAFNGPGDDLVISDTGFPFVKDSGVAHGLGRLDRSSFQVTPFGRYSGAYMAYGAELTTDRDGGLFGFFPNVPEAGSSTFAAIVVDGGPPEVVGAKTIPYAPPPDGDFAFFRWYDAYWIFLGPFQQKPPSSTILRYTPANGVQTVGTLPLGVTGAAVPPCP